MIIADILARPKGILMVPEISACPMDSVIPTSLSNGSASCSPALHSVFKIPVVPDIRILSFSGVISGLSPYSVSKVSTFFFLGHTHQSSDSAVSPVVQSMTLPPKSPSMSSHLPGVQSGSCSFFIFS